MTLIGDLFERDVTRPIPPVVYFQGQAPEELKREVEEYIITGGYPPDASRAVEGGIHEQFVRLLTAMRVELDKPGGPDLPACWISGFYGSGKSSFAKLLGLSLDGRKLPGGKLLCDALIAQDHSPDAGTLRLAWEKLVGGLKPIAVVFDVGSKARDDEHIHAVAVREVQHYLGYSKTSHLVAEYELKLEIEGMDATFRDAVQKVHGKPWGQLKDSQLVEDYFSAAIHELRPELFPEKTSWVDSRTGSTFAGKRSADEAVLAIQQMLDQRCPGRTLFIVVDEVSQYVHDDPDRMLALQSFVPALAQRMKGKAWLLATGQQKLEEGAGVSAPIVKLKDRFPSSLRVHLGVANIRDVVHKRLLRKKKLQEADLKELFHTHRPELDLCAYEGNEISEADFIEVYPMLPGYIGLLLDITTGLRQRSARTQGDSHAIRGLLQLLGDLFRDKGLVRYEVGHLISIDLVYDVLQSALNADVQMTIARAMEFCTKREAPLMARVVKAVAMLELVHDRQKTSTDLIARCLYERLGQGNQQPEIQEALDALVGESLLGYDEKRGYKIESSAGQEWQRERDGYAPAVEQQAAQVQQALEWLMGDVDRPVLSGMSIPWLALFSDNAGSKDVHIKDERKHTVVTVDFQFTKGQGRDHWVPLSQSPAYRDRIIWVVGDLDSVRHAATKLVQSHRMIDKYGSRQSSLPEDTQSLLIQERNRFDTAQKELTESVKAAFMGGPTYFRGRETSARDLGVTFTTALSAFGNRVVTDLYPNPTIFPVSEKDLVYLIENKELAAPPPVLGQDRLGILTLDAGRYEVTCTGRVPQDVLAHAREFPGVTGSTLLAHFGSPPHGTPPDVLRAAVVGLLRGGKIRVDLPGVGDLTSVRDEGARELLKDSGLRKAKLFENTKEPLSARDRNAIGALFKDALGKDVARNDEAIADAVQETFPRARERLTEIADRFRRLPKDTTYPSALADLEKALEGCRRSRQWEPMVTALKRALPALRDGLALLRRMEGDLTAASIDVLHQAEQTLVYFWPGLQATALSEEARDVARRIEAHLKTERPWEDTAELVPLVETLRSAYRTHRAGLLEAHARKLDQALEQLKRRDGFERLDPDQRHEVLRHLRDGGAAGTDERAIVPPLEGLEGLLTTKRESAEAKALAQLDAFLETLGESPTVEVALQIGGREIRSEAELDRFLGELRDRILHELAARHHVRLK